MHRRVLQKPRLRGRRRGVRTSDWFAGRTRGWRAFGFGGTAGIHKIKHVVVIMQENRSFDSYFGTFPGAAGIPMKNGAPTCVCARLAVRSVREAVCRSRGRERWRAPQRGERDRGHQRRPDERVRRPGRERQEGMPRHDGSGVRELGDTGRDGLPHPERHPELLVVREELRAPRPHVRTQRVVESPRASVPGLGMVRAVHRTRQPASCVNALQNPGRPAASPGTFGRSTAPAPIYAWTDLTYLMYKQNVSWGYYVVAGTEPDCENDAALSCTPVQPERRSRPASGTRCRTSTPSTPTDNSPTSNPSRTSTPPRRQGTLPAVSWVVPSGAVSEHPPAAVSAGQSYVTSLVNAVMRSKDWNSTAIFLAWDDWGGFYDHIVPPTVDVNGYGLRVPGHRHQPLRQARARSTTRPCRSTRTTSSSKTTSSTANASTPPPTDAPTPAPPSARTSRSSATSPKTSTSTSSPANPHSSPVHPKTTLTGTPHTRTHHHTVLVGHTRRNHQLHRNPHHHTRHHRGHHHLPRQRHQHRHRRGRTHLHVPRRIDRRRQSNLASNRAPPRRTNLELHPHQTHTPQHTHHHHHLRLRSPGSYVVFCNLVEPMGHGNSMGGMGGGVTQVHFDLGMHTEFNVTA